MTGIAHKFCFFVILPAVEKGDFPNAEFALWKENALVDKYMGDGDQAFIDHENHITFANGEIEREILLEDYPGSIAPVSAICLFWGRGFRCQALLFDSIGDKDWVIIGSDTNNVWDIQSVRSILATGSSPFYEPGLW